MIFDAITADVSMEHIYRNSFNRSEESPVVLRSYDLTLLRSCVVTATIRENWLLL